MKLTCTKRASLTPASLNSGRTTIKAAVSAMLLMLAIVPQIAGAQVRGAGATFPAPIYTKWFGQFQQATRTAVDYQAVGSGGGINALRNKTVDFGASDAPLSAEEERGMGGPVIHIPTVGGAVVLTYNLPGVPTGLKLTADVIAEIYLGKITSWNDARIKAINPGVGLPAPPIQPMHRSDGSGTTYIFTNYLKAVSGEWAAGAGAGKSVNWPTGLAGKGNPGVAALVKRTPGAIGYVELAYAIQNNLAYASVRNKAGKFVVPTVESTTAAIEQYVGQLKRDIKTPTVNAPGAASYPICSLTYILIYKNGVGQAGLATKLWSWALQPAQQAEAPSLYYAPLPLALVQINLAALKSVRGAQVQ
jgi:phosphate transport system substrate-binding protein